MYVYLVIGAYFFIFVCPQYCVIFMCTFGANNTDTEAPSTNSLLNNSLHNVDNSSSSPVDVAKLILPEKGEAVPQMPEMYFIF